MEFESDLESELIWYFRKVQF